MQILPLLLSQERAIAYIKMYEKSHNNVNDNVIYRNMFWSGLVLKISSPLKYFSYRFKLICEKSTEAKPGFTFFTQ